MTQRPGDDEDTFEHFSLRGWMRVRAAFTIDEATAMRTAAWRALASVEISQSDPSTWTIERPGFLLSGSVDLPSMWGHSHPAARCPDS